MNIHIVCPHCGRGWDDTIMVDWKAIVTNTDAQLVSRCETVKGSVNLVKIDSAFFLIVVEKDKLNLEKPSCKVVSEETALVLFDQAVSKFTGVKTQ